MLERVEISDDEDDDFEYNEVDEAGFLDDDDADDDEEDLATALASVNMGSPEKTAAAGGGAQGAARGGGSRLREVTQVRPSVVDDYIRNFLIKTDMKRSLDCFNTEWYELEAKGKLGEEYVKPVPDIYVRNAELDDQVGALRTQMAKMREVTAKAQGTWDKFRKERDFHRMHHKRVVQEKGKLAKDLRRLRKHFEAYEPTLKELQRKYEVAMKEKMLMRLERDRMKARVATLEATVKQLTEASGPAPAAAPTAGRRKPKPGRDSKLPPDDGSVVNPFAALDFDAPPVERFQLRKTFRGHQNSVSGIAFHPRKVRTPPSAAGVTGKGSVGGQWPRWEDAKCLTVGGWQMY